MSHLFIIFTMEWNKLRELFTLFIHKTSLFLNAPVAQLDRASAYGAEGCRFKSYLAYTFSPLFLIFEPHP
jgi:hypothetical protein